MFRKMLALVLVLCFAFTAAVPGALAEEIESPFMKALMEGMSKDMDSLLPQAAYEEPTIPTWSSKFNVKMDPGTTSWNEKTDGEDIDESPEMRAYPADSIRYVYDQHPVSSDPAVATGTFEVNKEGITDTIRFTIHAHHPGETKIKGVFYSESSYYITYSESGKLIDKAPFELSAIYEWIVNVTVKDVLQPPKVELRITPEPYTKLVTGKYRATEYLDITTKVIDAVFEKAPEFIRRFGLTPAEYRAVRGTKKSWQFNRRMRVYLERDIVTIPNSIRSKFPNLKLPASIKLPASSVKNFVINSPKWVSATAAAGKLAAQTLFKITPFEIAQWIVQNALEQVKSPRVEPEVTLEVVVTNPNSVPIYFDLWLSTPRVTHEGEKPMDVLEHLGSKLPDGVLSSPTEDPIKAQESFILYPEGDPTGVNKQIYSFKLDPEIVYNETLVDEMMSTHKRYVSDITASGTWGEWKGMNGMEPVGEYEESIQLEVESFLLPKSEYQQLEHLFSDLTTAVTEVFQSLTAAPGLPDSEFVDLLDALPEGAPLMSPIGPPAPEEAVQLFDNLDQSFSNLANPNAGGANPSAEARFDDLEDSFSNLVNP